MEHEEAKRKAHDAWRMEQHGFTLLEIILVFF